MYTLNCHFFAKYLSNYHINRIEIEEQKKFNRCLVYAMFAISIVWILVTGSILGESFSRRTVGLSHGILPFLVFVVPWFLKASENLYLIEFIALLNIALRVYYMRIQLSENKVFIRGGNSNNDADIIVIGAGTAGASIAYALSKQGNSVVVVEKNMDIQDRIVGELLQPGGYEALRKLGLESCAFETNEAECAGTHVNSVRIDGYVILLNKGNEKVVAELPYPGRIPKTFAEYIGYRRSPNGTRKPHGVGFHNGLFVQKLREKCKAQHNIRFISGTVTSLLLDNHAVQGVKYNLPESQGENRQRCLRSKLVIVADGMWSSLRKNVIPNSNVHVMSNFVGLILKNKQGANPPVPYPHFGHVVLGEKSMVLMYQVSPTETRILVDIPGKLPRSATGKLATYLLDAVAPTLPKMSQVPFIDAVHQGGIKSMPNRSLNCDQPSYEGVFLLGDTYNMRHPLTGGGMTVALNDAVLLSNLLGNISRSNSEEIHSVKTKFHAARKEHAATVNILANALYQIFLTVNVSSVRQSLRDACFDYLSLQGMFSAGPLGLLSGLCPKPMVLVVHFFFVAGFAVCQTLKPYPSISRIRKCWAILHASVTIIFPELEEGKATWLSWYPIRMVVDFLFPYHRQSINDF